MNNREAILRIKDHMEYHKIGEYPHVHIKEALDLAIVALEKDIPKKINKQSWCPNKCPTCDENLGGDCDDGYYDNPYFDRCPNCGQKLDFE